jgi:GNAT superfamily N-acetyltransferase
MTIRTFQPGDEAAQVRIYNEVAAGLPKFKAATLDEVRRRCHAADFDRSTRFFALHQGQTVGYASFHRNGRLSFPWCLPGHEGRAEALFAAVLEAMRGRGMGQAFAAYRADWPSVCEFFCNHGFTQVREMVNFAVDLVDLPTPAARLSSPITPLRPEDVPAVLALAPAALRVSSPTELETRLFHHPQIKSNAYFTLRQRTDGAPTAVGVLLEDPAYPDPWLVDAAMPCFRLGAFGTEGMQTKRIRGLFSFLVAPGSNVSPLGLDLISHAAHRLQENNQSTLAAQVPSDVPHLLRFYQQYFRRQGSFPVFERAL